MPDRPFTVIAHRGASGYLPEHTLEAAAVAHAMGADYVEQDVVLSRDGRLVVLHDLHLDAVTDVAKRFPGRQRADGRHYAMDFTLEELRTLRVHERQEPDGRPTYRGRFPPERAPFRVSTLEEQIDLIEGLNRSTGRRVGLYIEPKAPAWHREQGQDLVAAVIGLLDVRGYREPGDAVLLQSFDLDALRHARFTLGSRLTLVQLIGENAWQEGPTDFDWLRSEAGLEAIAEVAQGIGPWIPQILRFRDGGGVTIPGWLRSAQRRGLFVHAYTLRADRLPPGAPSLATALQALAGDAGVDGVFTDHPDRVLAFVRPAATDAGQAAKDVPGELP